ncbi:MAG: SufD family Fe-S cluster assembly protein [Patescibacteria group bacterium]
MEIIKIRQKKFQKKIRLAEGENRFLIWLLYRPETALCDLSFELAEGAKLNNFFLLAGKNKDKFRVNLAVNHCGRGSCSRTIIRAVLNDASSAEITGLVKIARSAEFSDAWFEGRALLFRDGSAKIKPNFEILTKEIQGARHGVTVSKISGEELFYLASRGIDLKKSEFLKAVSFLQSPFFCLTGAPEQILKAIKPLCLMLKK